MSNELSVGVRIRVTPQLRDQFTNECMRRGTKASNEIRKFMKVYCTNPNSHYFLVPADELASSYGVTRSQPHGSEA